LAKASTNSEFSIGPKLPVENATPPEARLSQARLSQAWLSSRLSSASGLSSVLSVIISIVQYWYTSEACQQA
jgi:hypothetical protein